jgi:regulator of protease activity HflC (stomatin/prohibitin superfamily)
MESVFGWLSDIFQAILSFFPRLVIIRSTHKLVKFVWGRNVVVCNSGLSIYWPIVTEIDLIPVVRQTTNLNTQFLTTKDGYCLGVAAILIYEVDDVQKLLTHTWDYEDTIKDFCSAAVKRYVCSNNFNDLLESSVSNDKKLTKELGNDLKVFGIKVIKFTLTDLASLQAFIIHGFINLHNSAEKK